jgi:hypothetical protein
MLDPIVRTIKDTEAYARDPVYIRLMQSYKAWVRLRDEFLVEDRYQLDELREIIQEKMKVGKAIKSFIKNYPVDSSTPLPVDASFTSLSSLEPIYQYKVREILRHGSPSAIQIVQDLLDQSLTYTEIYVRFYELYNQRHPDLDVPVMVPKASILADIYSFFFGGGATGNSMPLEYEVGS